MINLEPFMPFLLAAIIGLGLSVATLLVARKAGLAPYQAQLIDTLQDNAAALTTRVSQLEAEIDKERSDRMALQLEVSRLREVLADLVTENADLRKKLGMGSR